MEDNYASEFSKIALALTSGQLAKSTFVEELGAGEDIAFNFIGWQGSQIAVITQLSKAYMKLEQTERLNKCISMCRILKKYWDIDAITMLAEGYCSRDPGQTKGLDLHKAFEDKLHGVTECLTVTHAQTEEYGVVSITLVAAPYSYNVEKEVEYEDVLVYPEGAVNVVRDKNYPAMMYKILIDEEEHEDFEEVEMFSAIEEMNELGFHSQVFI